MRAIVTIARRQHADLEGLLRDEYGVARPEDLSLADASRLIDQLKVADALLDLPARLWVVKRGKVTVETQHSCQVHHVFRRDLAS